MARRIRDRVFGPGKDPGRWAEALGRANIPMRYSRARVQDVRDEQVRTWLKGVVDDPACWLGEGTGFVILGPYGTGKSSIAGILATDALMRCETVLWLAARDVPGVMFRDGERQRDLHDTLQVADLLVVDDLGSESYKVAGAGGAALEGCIRTLYDNGRSVVVTSNLGVNALKDHYPEPLISVLRRITETKVVE